MCYTFLVCWWRELGSVVSAGTAAGRKAVQSMVPSLEVQTSVKRGWFHYSRLGNYSVQGVAKSEGNTVWMLLEMYRLWLHGYV